MAIAYDQMPEEFQQQAIDIFGRQMSGEITQAQAEAEARANERAAEQAVAAGATPGSFLLTPPASADGGTTSGGTTSGGTEQTCPEGYIWDPVTQSCVVDETKTTMPVEDETGQKDPFTDPTQKPFGAPEGFDYVWTGSRWELQEVAQQGPTQSERQSALDVITALLEDYGLTGLSNFVYDLVFREDVMSGEAVLARIRADQGQAGDIYRARFAGNVTRRKAGLNVLSEKAYIAIENQFSQTMRAAGLPSGFYDSPDDFAALIGADVSPSELVSRINEGYLAVQQANPQVTAEMRRLYGVDDSMLAAYFLDPQRATPILLRQANAAQIAAEGTLQAQRQISAMTAEELAVAGVTQQVAREGFQKISAAEELFVALPGTTEQAITEQEQIGGVFGTSAAAQQRIRQRSRERQAMFEAGGRFAGQGTTVTGLQ
jgi:hypothetical protein